MPGRRDRRERQADAFCDCIAVHRLRLVPGTLPDGLHFNGSGGAGSRVDRRPIRLLRAQRHDARRERLQRVDCASTATDTREQRASAVAAAIARAQQRRGTAKQ